MYGHLHMPTSAREGDVAFEEVSCGYPRERDGARYAAQTIACGR